MKQSNLRYNCDGICVFYSTGGRCGEGTLTYPCLNKVEMRDTQCRDCFTLNKNFKRITRNNPQFFFDRLHEFEKYLQKRYEFQQKIIYEENN